MNGWSVANVVVLTLVAVASGVLLADSLIGRTQLRNAPPWSPPWPSPSRHGLAPRPLSQRPQVAPEGATTAIIIGVVGLAFVALCALVSLVLARN